MNHLQEMKARLDEITTGCRVDMHEPGEQGLAARVVGNYLDNASGHSTRVDAITGGYQEFVVVLERDGSREPFNLASLIALARLAVIGRTK